MSDFPRIRPATVLQRIPKNGVADSAAMNAFMEQVVHDLSEIFSAVNGPSPGQPDPGEQVPGSAARPSAARLGHLRRHR